MLEYREEMRSGPLGSKPSVSKKEWQVKVVRISPGFGGAPGSWLNPWPGRNDADSNSIFRYNEDGDGLFLSEEALERAEKGDATEPPIDQSDLKEQQEIRRLQSRDRQVRQHEQAHIAASGRISTSGPTYRLEQGPDGRMYVTEGSVSFRMPPACSPKERLELAQQLRQMALAPANPSAKDRGVAARAAQMISKARLELAAEQHKEE